MAAAESGGAKSIQWRFHQLEQVANPSGWSTCRRVLRVSIHIFREAEKIATEIHLGISNLLLSEVEFGNQPN